MPVWPGEYRPGSGHTRTPGGPLPTGMRASRRPVVVSMAYTLVLLRPDSHNTVPSAETLPIAGIPPPGSLQVADTRRVAKSITETDPASRFENVERVGAFAGGDEADDPQRGRVNLADPRRAKVAH